MADLLCRWSVAAAYMSSLNKQINTLSKKEVPHESLTSFLYWNARVHKEAPALRTTFGNFTTLNSVVRIPFSNSTGQNTVLIVFWSASGLSVISGIAGSSIISGTFTGSMYNSGGFACRPLRLSYSLECTTQLVNIQGEVVILNTDQAINLPIGYAATTLGDINTSLAFWNSMSTLVFGSPDSVSKTAKHYADDPQDYVLPPASYVAYNQYYDIAPSTSGGLVTSPISSGDAYAAFNQTNFAPGVGPVYPFTVATVANATSTIADVPSMRMSIIVVPPTTNLQSYVLTVHRQDGVRFPNNTIGAAFQATPKLADAKAEDRVLDSIRRIAGFPAISFDSEAINDMVGVATASAIETGLSYVTAGISGKIPGLNNMIGNQVGKLFNKSKVQRKKKVVMK